MIHVIFFIALTSVKSDLKPVILEKIVSVTKVRILKAIFKAIVDTNRLATPSARMAQITLGNTVGLKWS